MYHHLAGYWLLCVPWVVAAAPFVEHIEPPLVEQGKTTRLTFVGRELDQAVGLWHAAPAGSLQAAVVESTATKTVIDVTTTANATVGLTGVRLATRNGLSNMHLLLIDDLPLRKTSDEVIPLPVVVHGVFREGEVDRYSINVQAKQTLSFEVVASRLGKDADPIITIRNAQGKMVRQQDNDQGLFYDCRFEHTFADAGRYTVDVRDSRFHGSPHRRYALRMGRFPAARVVLPNALKSGQNTITFPELPASSTIVERPTDVPAGPFSMAVKRTGDEGSAWFPFIASDEPITVARERDGRRTQAFTEAASPATTFAFNLSPWRANPFASLDRLLLTGRMQATPATASGVWCGVLRQPVERQGFVFDLAKGQSVYLKAEAKALNSPAELEMMLTDRFGREQRRAQERNDELTLDFTANNAGQYGLLLRDQLRDGGAAFTYRVTVRDKPFPPNLVADVEGLTIPQGSYQTVPITITRMGTTGPVKLKLLNAPAGLTLTPDEIGDKENAVVCRLQATKDVPQGLYAVQIVAESSSGVSLVRQQPLIDKQIINVDLIPLALREDQKRLPPSVADRFAVQITPPAPFTFEVAEANITLPRYQQASIPLTITRQNGFTSPIDFTAKGGQLADKKEGRTRVYVDFPVSTPQTNEIRGTIHSKILSNLGKVRIDVSALAPLEGHTITLTRTFELNLTTAFQLRSEPGKVTLAPGETTVVRIHATREKSFAEAITLKMPIVPGLTFPETVTIPKGQTFADLTIKTSPDTTPNRYNIQAQAHAQVSGFEEELRVTVVELEVRKPEVKKK